MMTMMTMMTTKIVESVFSKVYLTHVYYLKVNFPKVYFLKSDKRQLVKTLSCDKNHLMIKLVY